MKKILTLTLALALVLSLAACGGNNTASGNNDDTNLPASALELLSNVWASYAEDEKFYAMGGDISAIVENAPGAYSLADPAAATATLMVPGEEISKISEAASLMNGMMANFFTCGVYRLADGQDAKAFAETMKTAFTNGRWVCGMPEQMLIASIGNQYVIAAFGLADSISTFQNKLTSVYSNTQVLYTDPILA